MNIREQVWADLDAAARREREREQRALERHWHMRSLVDVPDHSGQMVKVTRYELANRIAIAKLCRCGTCDCCAALAFKRAHPEM
jgi:hypothetical protein